MERRKDRAALIAMREEQQRFIDLPLNQISKEFSTAKKECVRSTNLDLEHVKEESDY